VAAPVQEIFADPATLTGSIGVIVMHQDLSGLLGKLGVKSETVKSGKLKDMLTPTEPLGEEAREIVVELVEDVYDQFLKAVAEGREMEMAEVRKLADGRIFTGAQAKEEGLVDQLGGLQDALRRAGELAHIPGKPKVKEYEAPSLLRLLLGSAGVRRSQVTVTGGLLYDDFAARLASGALESPLRPGDM
jgi:protease-4